LVGRAEDIKVFLLLFLQKKKNPYTCFKDNHPAQPQGTIRPPNFNQSCWPNTTGRRKNCAVTGITARSIQTCAVPSSVVRRAGPALVGGNQKIAGPGAATPEARNAYR
jgi:hypothetical protein